MASMLVTLFNDKNEDHSSSLQKEIDNLSGIEQLKYKPDVLCGEVGEADQQANPQNGLEGFDNQSWKGKNAHQAGHYRDSVKLTASKTYNFRGGHGY
jgi:hypothetical protein